MPKITYIEHAGREHTVDVPQGLSVMRGAVDNNIPGIDADCGGECACATCHVYVDEATFARLPLPDDIERAMLESTAAERKPNSRLSCQIRVSEKIAGIVLTIPDRQY